ncbi:SIR2 family NAD-dependent protein deacylase [Leuconostoc citreum]|uniref:SIR2 family NAD-dependent protein deacylase n=1 Tax=Leuconostoc citreum TaxID=33964 RepID=UPI0032DF4D8F
MSKLKNGMLNQILSAAENDSLILFVGAGVSKNSGIPLWDELVSIFVEELDLDEEDDKDLLKIPQYYYDIFGKNRYYQKLEDFFKTYQNAEPNEIHDLIAEIKPKHIITTNYDNLIEKRLNESVMKYDVISDDFDIPYVNSNHYLIKMHGDLIKKNLVLKEQDYDNYEDNFYMISTLIQTLIMNNTVLFIGYSLKDKTFNNIFRIVQNIFGNNAKKAYFYSPDFQSSTQRKYYEGKGIHILSNADKDKEPGILLKNFLLNFLKESHPKPKNNLEVWNNIKFLNNLSFIEAETIVKYTNLSPNAFLYNSVQFSWNPIIPESIFEINSNKKLVKLITKKTRLSSFLGENIKRDDLKFQENEFLSRAFEQYKDGKHQEAKKTFRELANYAYKRKDYWNYLVAEFNIQHINDGLLRKSSTQLIDPVVKDSSFEKIMDGFIENENQEVKELVYYFKNEIYSFKFVYVKLFKIDSLLDKIRQEHFDYKNGGVSSNSSLFEIREKIASFHSFIECNKITIYHYAEYKKIIERYFEALLLALDNSLIKPVNPIMLNQQTPSTIEELTLEDLQPILDHWPISTIDNILENLNIKKIMIDKCSFDFIVTRITDQLTHNSNDTNSPRRLIDVLYHVQIKDVKNIIEILNLYQLKPSNYQTILKLLNIIIEYKNVLNERQIEDLVSIIKSHISQVIEKDLLDEINSEIFFAYKILLDYFSHKNKSTILKIPELQRILLLMQKNVDPIETIEKYDNLLSSFFSFLDNRLKKQVLKVLTKYEKKRKTTFKLQFVTELIFSKVYNFSDFKDSILNKYVQLVKKDQQTYCTFPDKKKESILIILNLLQCKYLDRVSIEKKHVIMNKMRGEYPEVDWIWFGDYSHEVAKKILNNYGLKKAKEYFASTAEQEEIFNHLTIIMSESEN